MKESCGITAAVADLQDDGEVSNLREADSPKELTSTSKSEQVPSRGCTIPELLEITRNTRHY